LQCTFCQGMVLHKLSTHTHCSQPCFETILSCVYKVYALQKWHFFFMKTVYFTGLTQTNAVYSLNWISFTCQDGWWDNIIPKIEKGTAIWWFWLLSQPFTWRERTVSLNGSVASEVQDTLIWIVLDAYYFMIFCFC